MTWPADAGARTDYQHDFIAEGERCGPVISGPPIDASPGNGLAPVVRSRAATFSRTPAGDPSFVQQTTAQISNFEEAR